MARNRGSVPARLGSLVMILGIGIVGCSTPVDSYDGYNTDGSVQTNNQGASSSSHGNIVRTSYQPPRAGGSGTPLLPPPNNNGGKEPAYLPPPSPVPGPMGDGPPDAPPPQPLPTELAMTTLPSYIIEPPDILFIDAIRIVPKPPYRIEPLDVLIIQVGETLPNQPIGGTTPYPVSPDGTVNLGFSYGMVRVAGLTLEQAAQNIQQHLRRTLNNPTVSVTLAQFRGVQQTRGEHLVQMDGCISLGSYGCVHVTGLTVSQAKCVIEKHLSRWLLNPEISLSVAAFNSKVYYVIFDGGGYGQQVFRLPITGKDTVLDAISQINGLPPVSSSRKIWVARPTPAKKGCYQILPVNWRVLTQAGDTETNYQLFPGDRIYVKANSLLHFNNRLSQVLYPFNNAAGATLIGFGSAGIIRGVTSGTSTGAFR
ncbi:MAG TPA: polysaccharide biosynthesis/export family protein [Gemmataceae bacterium]|nr:polysaccharide biosynthesis/export family protein [Gemmataceae bacterium]